MKTNLMIIIIIIMMIHIISEIKNAFTQRSARS